MEKEHDNYMAPSFYWSDLIILIVLLCSIFIFSMRIIYNGHGENETYKSKKGLMANIQVNSPVLFNQYSKNNFR